MAHAILVTAYHLLARKTTYHEPGADYYDGGHVERVRDRAIRALEQQDTAWCSNRQPERETRSRRVVF